MNSNHDNFIHICRVFRQNTVQDRYLLYLAVQDSFSLVPEQGILSLKAGDCCLLQPNTAHSLRLQDPSPVLAVDFPSEIFQHATLPFLSGCPLLSRFFSDSMRCIKTTPYLHFEKHGEDITPFFLRMETEYQKAAPYYQSILMCDLISAIVRLCRSYWVHAAVSGSFRDDPFDQVVTYLLKNYRTATLESASKHVNYHPNTVSALIRRETGDTFSHLLRDIRLRQAAYLLSQNSMPVEEVAAECGYEHLGHFYQIFKDMYGVTPKVYALKHHADAK